MYKFRFKAFSGVKVLGYSGQTGFIKGRKYDTDLDRFGRISTAQGELRRTGDIQKEMREMHSILRRGLTNNLKE